MTGLVYPQLTQWPVVKRLRRRTVVNRTADGRAIKLGDPAGVITEWELRYVELGDSEAATLRQFFESAEGSLLPFLFVDPTDNLLVGSEALDGSSWSRGPMLQVSGGPVEWRLENTGAGPQDIWQDIGGPSGFVYCFSVEARADEAAGITLMVGSARTSGPLGGDWRRLKVSGRADETRFGIEVPQASAINVRRLQVEAQPGTSMARPAVGDGVYAEAHFRDDTLEVIATGLNRHSCTVNIIHANHI